MVNQKLIKLKFKTDTIKQRFCHFADIYICVKGNIKTAAGGEGVQIVFNKNHDLKNRRIAEAGNIDISKSMWKLVEHSNNYSKTSRSFWHYCRDKPGNSDLNVTNVYSGYFTF